MTEQEVVKASLEEICSILGYSTGTMTQRNYDHLCQEIESKTGTLISVSTIKRLLNGEFAKIPQTATLNAISTYLGYKNWQENKVRLLHTTSDSSSATRYLSKGSQSNNNINTASHISKSTRLKWLILIIPLIVLLAFIKFKSKPVFKADQASFSVHRTTNNDIPNTVIFKYDIEKVVADSFFIQQSWDKNRRTRISKGTHTITDIYYEPGYHTAKLIANDSIIRTIEISIPSDRWFFYAYEMKPENYPIEIKTNNPVHDGHLGIDHQDLLNNHIKIEAEPIYFTTYFPSKYAVSSDSFIFETMVRIKDPKPLQCPFIVCEIFGQHGSIYITSRTKGCAHKASVQLGLKHIDGSTTDLSMLCDDLYQWITFGIKSKGNQLQVYKNNLLVYSSDEKSDIGLITGLGFLSNGLCETERVFLQGMDGKVVYENDFKEK